MTRTPARTLVIGALILLAGCGHDRVSTAGGRAPAAAPAPVAIDPILTLLDDGDVAGARTRIADGLAREPGNASLQVLRDSIDRDPKELLGPNGFAYTVKPGETMSELATRFLGNRLKAYQLSRYNGIARPASLAAGQVLRIPAQPPHSESVARPEPRGGASAPRPHGGAGRGSAAAPARPAVVPRGPDPAAAQTARAAGLAALNQGQVVRSVGLLRRAATLDPANPAIARDLARASRIAATVRARR